MILDVIVEDKKKRLIEDKARVSEADMKKARLECDRVSISFEVSSVKAGFVHHRRI